MNARIRDVNDLDLEIEVTHLENLAIITNKDPQSIKPSYFKYSHLMNICGQTCLTGFNLNFQNEIKEYSGEIIEESKHKCEDTDIFDVKFFNVVPEEKELIHQAPIWYNRKLITEYGQNVLGNSDIFHPTYLKKNDLEKGRLHLGRNNIVQQTHQEGLFRAYFLFTISIPKLLQYRTIFYDPEGLLVKANEYKNTFLVFGGIPFQSISKYELKLEKIKYI